MTCLYGTWYVGLVNWHDTEGGGGGGGGYQLSSRAQVDKGWDQFHGGQALVYILVGEYSRGFTHLSGRIFRGFYTS